MIVLRRIWKHMGNLLFSLVVILAVMLLGLRLAGWQAYTVLSGSMEPEIPAGALIYVRSIKPETLVPGDIITFLLNSDTTATHRIVEMTATDNGYLFQTKGDANKSPDAARIHSKDVIGVPVLTVPGVGYALGYLQSTPGMFLAMSVGAISMLVLLILDWMRDRRRNQKPGKYLRQQPGKLTYLCRGHDATDCAD